MARDIDVSDMEALSQEDLMYLSDRGRLTAEQEALITEKRPEPEAPNLEDTPYTGDENTAPPAPSAVTEEEVSYEDMSNNQLRLELASRSLSTSGNKADMIARLTADDEDNAEEEEAE